MDGNQGGELYHCTKEYLIKTMKDLIRIFNKIVMLTISKITKSTKEILLKTKAFFIFKTCQLNKNSPQSLILKIKESIKHNKLSYQVDLATLMTF